VSVGLARLREEPDAIRKGAADKGEDPGLVDAALWPLLRGVRRGDPIFAFWSATELSVGLEGLPRQHRPATHEALLARGFTGEDRWLYLTGPAAAAAPDRAPARSAGASDSGRCRIRRRANRAR